jgi:WD40 repeat protein
MFSRCAKLLMEPQQRLHLNAGKTNGLLDYAARNWSYHLSKSRAFQAADSMRDLLDFFNKGAVQVWIQFLASFSLLKLAVSSSRMVTGFLEDKMKKDHVENPLRGSTDEEKARQWLTDIVRLVGKFGAELTLYPKLIFRIAAFCPKDSIFRQTFESSSAILVTGDEDEWDDYYARFSLDHHSPARVVECSLDHFVVVDSKNRLSAFDALTTIRMHLDNGEGDFICCRMSTIGSIFVACELTYTTIWNLYDGKRLFRFTNPLGTRVRDVCSTDGELAVLIFCDEGVFRMPLKGKLEWQCIGRPSEVEAAELSPSIVRLKPDGSQMALAYEGFPLSVWTTDNLQHIARCSRTVAKPPTPPTHVRRMDWNMATGQIIGVYSSGNVFIWNPQDNKYTLHEMDALEIACSTNGSLFTTTSANGVVQVWNFYTCALIYQVTAAFETSALALSPDGRCLYDIRGPIINIWQPNSLIKWAEEEERDSDSSSSSAPTIREGSLASINGTRIREPVSGLAVHPDGSMFCMGNEAGSIRLTKNDGTIVHEINGESAINHVVWSPDGAYIAYSSIKFRIAVLDTQSLIWVFHATAAGPIHQLLFSHDGHKLLVTSDAGFFIYSIQQNYMCCSRTGWIFQQCLNHPLDKDLLLAIRFSDSEVLHWSDLSTLKRMTLDNGETPIGLNEGKLTLPVNRILPTADKASLLLAATCPWRLRDNISDISLIPTPTSEDPSANTTRTLPLFLLHRLRCTIGFMNGACSDVLVFLDNKSWVCTWPLDGSAIKKHFLLPADWLSKEQLNLASVTRDGVIHFPRNGKVLIIRSGFEEEWDD